MSEEDRTSREKKERERKGRSAPESGELLEIEKRLRQKLKGSESSDGRTAGDEPEAEENAGPSERTEADERLRGKREKVTGGKRGRKVIAASVAAALAFTAAVFLMTSGQFGRPKEPTPEEKKYWGRYLPKDYSEPKLTEQIDYGKASRIKMTRINAAKSGNALSISVGEVIKNRIVYFEYRKAGADPVSLMAYIKPSGRLFVGASYCPPCQSRYQRIEGDSTITCEVCGTKRDLEGMIGISGACKLYPIDEFPTKVIGDKIYLDAGVIDRYSPQPIDRPVGTL